MKTDTNIYVYINAVIQTVHNILTICCAMSFKPNVHG